jgi:hypothetical protein
MLASVGCSDPDRVNGPGETTARPVGPLIKSAVPTSGLIGDWKLDESNGTVAHDSKYNYDASVLGGAAFVAGKLGNALSLTNGSAGTGGKYAQMPSNLTLDNVQEGDYTLSAWFRPSTLPPNTSVDNRMWAIVGKASPNLGIFYSDAGKFLARHVLTGGVGEQPASPSTYPVGFWYHVAVTVNKALGKVRLYVNGGFVDDASFAANTAADEYGTTPFQIGKFGTQWAADGKVDQVRIYNRTLTDAEVLSLAQETAPVARPLPVGVTGTTVIGFGPGDDTNGQQWGVLLYPPSPSTISSDIDAADAKNVLLVLLMPANKGAYSDASGKFSLSMYENSLDRWVTGKANSKVDQATADKIADAMARRRIVCYIIDEPNLNGFATPAQVEQMAEAHKARWDCLTFVRTTPSLLASSWSGYPRTTTYPKVDYAWSQYNPNTAGTTPDDVWAQERQAITSAGFNMGLAVSLNLWAGGIPQNIAGQQACWDYAKNGTSSGYVLGDREGTSQATTVNCGTLGSSTPSVIASPNWIKYFAQRAAADGGFPFMLMWEAADASSSSTDFSSYYYRSDFVSAFDNAIQTGQGAQAAAWRTPK